jgi:hypothetical protein
MNLCVKNKVHRGKYMVIWGLHLTIKGQASKNISYVFIY